MPLKSILRNAAAAAPSQKKKVRFNLTGTPPRRSSRKKKAAMPDSEKHPMFEKFRADKDAAAEEARTLEAAYILLAMSRSTDGFYHPLQEQEMDERQSYGWLSR